MAGSSEKWPVEREDPTGPEMVIQVGRKGLAAAAQQGESGDAEKGERAGLGNLVDLQAVESKTGAVIGTIEQGSCDASEDDIPAPIRLDILEQHVVVPVHKGRGVDHGTPGIHELVA